MYSGTASTYLKNARKISSKVSFNKYLIVTFMYLKVKINLIGKNNIKTELLTLEVISLVVLKVFLVKTYEIK